MFEIIKSLFTKAVKQTNTKIEQTVSASFEAIELKEPKLPKIKHLKKTVICKLKEPCNK